MFFEGRVALVTGAGSGIGLATACSVQVGSVQVLLRSSITGVQPGQSTGASRSAANRPSTEL